MANSRRDQKHLGIDTNALVAYLDSEHPQHDRTRNLKYRRIALNPSVIHEAYHTLVFKIKWTGEEASDVLKDIMTDEDNLFINQSFQTTIAGLNIAIEYHLGGRDALIAANFIAGKIRECRTFDEKLLELKKVRQGRSVISFAPP